MEKNKERCCGNCCWFKHEDSDGYGICYKHDAAFPNCGNTPCLDYVSEQKMRHHLAVLIQHNRWRRDRNVPNSRKMVEPTELGNAIDFATEYIKTFIKI